MPECLTNQIGGCSHGDGQGVGLLTYKVNLTRAEAHSAGLGANATAPCTAQLFVDTSLSAQALSQPAQGAWMAPCPPEQIRTSLYACCKACAVFSPESRGVKSEQAAERVCTPTGGARSQRYP